MRAALIAALVSIAAILPGCSTGASPAKVNAPIGQPLEMAPGQQVSLPDGATLRYLEVAADSRCPPGVQCIRAGDADVAFEFAGSAQVPRRFTINTQAPATTSIGAWQLRLLELAFGDQPSVTVRIDAEQR